MLFGRNFLKHPKMLGSLIPSSRFLVNHVLREVDWARARVFLEYGPGVGTFTTEILRLMRPDAVLIVLETNADFVRYVRNRIWPDREYEQAIHREAIRLLESVHMPDPAVRFRHDRIRETVVTALPETTLRDHHRALAVAMERSVRTPMGCFKKWGRQ